MNARCGYTVLARPSWLSASSTCFSSHIRTASTTTWLHASWRKFLIGEDAIRIAGTRVGIETVVRDYRHGASPEEMVLRYPTLSLEQVHAAITYYLANRDRVETYLQHIRQRQEDAWQEQPRHPSEFVISLRERLDRQQQALGDGEAQSVFAVEE